MAQDWQAESAARKAAIAQTLADMKLTVESVFVPFSQSRNKKEKHKTLNWIVTVKRDGRDVLKTEYSAGIAYCPGYVARKAPSSFVPHQYKTHDGKPYKGTTSAYRHATEYESLEQYRNAIAAAECESGFPMEIDPWSREVGNIFRRKPKGAAILPDPVDVFYSLTMDSDVLDHGGFESWADDCGYEVDSRSAESTYRACLELALKMRAAIGESGISLLRDALTDY